MARPPADAPLLNQDLIFDTAVKFVQANGPAALSIRKLAAELDVSPKSLYHHVPNKAALMRGVYSRLLTDFRVDMPDTADWETQFRAVAHNFRNLMQNNRGMVHAFATPLAPLERNLQLYELVFSILLAAGLDEETVGKLGHVVVNMLVGFVVAEMRGRFSVEALSRYENMIAESTDQFPTLHQVGISAPVTEMSHMFEFFVDGVIDIVSAKQLSR